MPLIKGKKASTKKGFSENIKREIKAGKPQKQAIAIVYSQARNSKRSKKKTNPIDSHYFFIVGFAY